MLQTILSISGKPGLYKLVSSGKASLIVEAIDETHKRMPAFATDRVTSLADIAMYTDSEDVPLWQVLKNVGEKEQLKPCSLNYKLRVTSCATILARCYPHSTATVCTIATSVSLFNGTTFW